MVIISNYATPPPILKIALKGRFLKVIKISQNKYFEVDPFKDESLYMSLTSCIPNKSAFVQSVNIGTLIHPTRAPFLAITF